MRMARHLRAAVGIHALAEAQPLTPKAKGSVLFVHAQDPTSAYGIGKCLIAGFRPGRYVITRGSVRPMQEWP
jgi:hypothetical protein